MNDVNPFRRLRAAPDLPSVQLTEADELAALLRSSGRGDQGAFASLYDRIAPMVLGIVTRVVRDPAQSEEVTQEVFVEIWRLAPRFEETKGSVKGWAATIAHRRAVDRVRSVQASRNRDDNEGRKARPDFDQVSEEVEDRMDRQRVRRALDALTATQREAVELAYYGGHTYREVAVLLDVAEGTVKTRIRDGLIRLRDEMGVAT